VSVSEATAIHRALVDPTPLVDAKPLVGSRGWIRLFGPIASLLILVAVIYQLRTIDIRALLTMLPSAPTFWLVFAAYYLASPISEWLIFRRLWSLPVGGMTALLRKLVSNELLLGYSGELYFYTWARRHARMAAAPFGTIKDVAILSAIAGNAFCLFMVIWAWPLLDVMRLHVDSRTIDISACIVMLPSVAAMLFRRRLFTLSRTELWFVATIQAVRIMSVAALAAIMWHLLLPAVALSWWLLLSAVRQMISRLPLLPNKDVVFVGVAALLVGSEGQIAEAMTLVASIILVTHLCVGAALSLSELLAENDA